MSTEPKKWIVVFKDNVTKEQIDEYIKEVEANGGTVTNRWDGGILNGFAATMTESSLDQFKGLRDDKIDYVEPDQIVTIT